MKYEYHDGWHEPRPVPEPPRRAERRRPIGVWVVVAGMIAATILAFVVV